MQKISDMGEALYGKIEPTGYPDVAESWNVISPDEFRLAPWAQTTALQLRVDLVPPFTHDLWYEITFGCSGSPVRQILVTVPVSEVTEAYQTFQADRSRAKGLALARRAFGLDHARVQSAISQ